MINEKWEYSNTVGGLRHELQFCRASEPIAWVIWRVKDVLYQARLLNMKKPTETEAAEALEAMHYNLDKRRGLNGQEVKRWLLESIPEEWER